MWVVFDQVDFDGSEVHAGHIWTILPDDDVISFENDNYGKYALSLRTTETIGAGGYIHGELIDT